MLDLKATTEVHERLRRLLKNRDWVNNNVRELQANYAEKWVAIVEEKVVAHGSTSDEVREQVKGKFPLEEMLILAFPKGELQKPI